MEESLLTAARRIVRFLRVDLDHDGGLISRETERALIILDRMIFVEEKHLKQKACSELVEGEDTIAAVPAEN